MAKTYNNHKNDKVSIQAASSTKDQHLKEVSNIHRLVSVQFWRVSQGKPPQGGFLINNVKKDTDF